MVQKLKSNRSACKRFKKLGKSNNFKHRQANRSHLNTKMNGNKKRKLKLMTLVKKCNIKSLKKQIPY